LTKYYKNPKIILIFYKRRRLVFSTKRNRRRFVMLLLLLSVSATIVYASVPPWILPRSTVIKYTTSRVNLRRGPSAESDILKTLNSGVSVEFQSIYNLEWSAVVVDGTRGFVSSGFLVDEKSPEPTLPPTMTPAPTSTPSPEPPPPDHSGEAVGGVHIESLDELLLVGEMLTETLDEETTDEQPAGRNVELLAWNEVKPIFTIGAAAEVYDVRTGLTYYVKSFSNGNHADIEPITTEDTATIKRTFNNSWTWDGRPVWVTINGRTIAAAINGMPHGRGVNGNNGMNGQICLHFRGSTVHNGNMRYSQQLQAVVTEAYNAAN
jgi:uncharacterized protein YgiM (DUF1202 family)